MTKQELRAFRGQAREIAQLKESLDRMRDEIGPKGTDFSAVNVQNSGNSSPVESFVLGYLELEQRYRDKLIIYYEERARIEDAITILTPNERAVIRSYYLDRMTWEETAYKLHFSYPHTHRIHAAALKKLEEE